MGKVKTPSFKGGFKGSAVEVEWEGLKQTAFLLAAIANTDLPKNLNGVHLRKIKTLADRAEANFNSSIRRPNEEGARGHARETGNFTFGSDQGGAFVGVMIIQPQIDTYGFGYPNVKRADQKTHFVWRALEFGLRPHPAAVIGPFSPRGRAKFPKKFTFLPFASGPPNGVLVPRASGSGPSGKLVTPKGRVLKTVSHPGIEPKLFITRAFEETVGEMDGEYQKVLGSTFKDFS